MAISPLQEWFPEWLLDSLIPLSEEASIWLVGGALRDKFLNRETLDYDFAVDENARDLARTFANSLGAHYFDLDPQRDTGRVIYLDKSDHRYIFDFARLRGNSIEEDLISRDFTINSLAIDLLAPHELIDPTKGLRDIKDGHLRASSLHSFVDDPVRVLRAVRFSILIKGRIEANTLRLLRDSAKELVNVSIERIRDEIFRIFALSNPISALRLMDHLNLFSLVFPELEAVRDVSKSAPHERDGWNHTLAVVDHLGSLLTVMSPEHGPDGASQLVLGEYKLRLGRFRNELNEYFNGQLSQGRSIRQLIILAALYHESGKPMVMKEVDGSIQYHDHEKQGAEIIRERANVLRLSKSEISWLAGVIEGHLRPSLLSRNGEITNRSIYRFLRDTEGTVPGVLLLSLADVLAKSDPPIDQEIWGAHIEIVRELLGAYFSHDGISLQQEPLLRGDEIASELGIAPGPEIGRIIMELKEAQAVGEVRTKSEAIAFAQDIKDRSASDM
jgi:tRNA nucleotidyltransferase/poly(A) polymerase